MRKFPILLVILILLGLMYGCSTNGTNQSRDEKSSHTSSPGSGQSQATAGQGTQVIAKSDGTVSSKEKEAILSEIDQEMDSLIESINRQEDISDEDLKH